LRCASYEVVVMATDSYDAARDVIRVGGYSDHNV
jgi:hypothetical protein